MTQDQLDIPVATQEADEFLCEEKRPGALRTLWRSRELIASLTYRDIRSRYKQSILGIAWALLTPVAQTIVFTVVFSKIMKVPTHGQPAAVFIYVVMVPWTFFANGILTGSDCLITNFNLITKIYFPREVFPISAILGKLVDFTLGALLVMPLFYLYHIHITWWALMAVPLIIVQMCFMLGLTFIFSSVNLFYRDVKHIVPVMTQLWLYLTPIFYEASMVSKGYPGIYPYYMVLNPMAPIICSFRNVALYGQAPLWHYLGIATLVSLACVVGGYVLFKRLEPAFAETI
jgi:lipopolysaccharide transport system permease protein